MKSKKLFISSILLILIYSLFKITLGIHGDELHTVAVGDMLTSGSSFFKETWFYLQLSGVINAPFIYIFKLVTGSTEGLVLYLRVISVFIQLFISLYFYKTFKDDFNETSVMIASCIFFMYVPDFRNMVYKVELMWFTLLLISYIFSFAKTSKVKYLVYSGIAISLSVLSYPPSVVIVLFLIPMLIFICHSTKLGFLKSYVMILLTCGICGLAFVSYALCSIGLHDFIQFFPKILSDENITGTFYSKFIHPSIKVLFFIVAPAVCILICNKIKSKITFIKHVPVISLLIFIAFLGQTFIERDCITWHIITYAYAATLGICIMFFSKQLSDAAKNAVYIFTCCCLSVIACMIIASNQGNISCTMGTIFSAMLLILISPDCYSDSNVCELLKEKKIYVGTLILTSVFAFVYPVYEYETTNFEVLKPTNIFTSRTLVEKGPLKGLYLGNDIYSINNQICDTIIENVSSEDKLCIIDESTAIASIGYICSDAEYATYSPQGGYGVGLTGKLESFYSDNPQKEPTVVLINPDYTGSTIEEYLSSTTFGLYLTENSYTPIKFENGYWILKKEQ